MASTGIAAGSFCLSFLVPLSASAFTIDTRVSHGCHERISLAALARAGWPDGRSPPALDELDHRILADLPFEVPAEAHDPWTLAVLVGVRDNDLKGVAPSDLPGLSGVHNDPLLQAEHCLRRPRDDGPEGDASALAACRSFILGELALALGGGDQIDLEARTTTKVYLAFRGEVEISVRRFGFHLGRALHALQDSHSHSFRAPSDGRVRHVLNFVDHARREDFTESRDGHAHVSELDLCGDEDDPLLPRASLAETASLQVLEALVDANGGREGRVARLQAAVDRALLREVGCEVSNRWCEAPELEIASNCRAQAPVSSAGWPWLGFAFLAILLIRARRTRVVPLLLLLVLSSRSAEAAETSTSTPERSTFAIYAGTSVAIDRGAFAVTGGVRWRAFESMSFGLNLEFNPWFSIDAATVAPGVINLYSTARYHWIRVEGLELRSTVNLGSSVLLFDLVGADAGSVGVYFGLSLLGISARLGEHWALVFEPADLAFPIPHLRGVPFYYRQYRVTLGLEWNP